MGPYCMGHIKRVIYESTKFYETYLCIMIYIYMCMKDYINPLIDQNNWRIKYEKDIYELIDIFDVFVHVPINKTSEAFGQVYIQSLLLGKFSFPLFQLRQALIHYRQICELVLELVFVLL